MKVILRNEVENLGKNGDVLVVADGYGRNYLLPKGLAVKATPQNLKQLESAIKAREEQCGYPGQSRRQGKAVWFCYQQ